MSTTLPLYWNLSSAVKEERIDASVKLVGALQEFQSQYIPSAAQAGTSSDSETSEGPAEDEPKEIENDIDILNAEDVRYAIRRLGRGLASPRESSRLGFAVALTELLSRLDTVSSTQIISLVVNSTQIHGSMQGHEVRDQFFARLFGLVSVIQSGLLFRESTLPASQSTRTLASTLTDFQTVCSELVALGGKKSWLRESCWWAFGLAIDGLDTARISWKAEAIQWTAEKVLVENKIWTREKLALTLSIQRMDPSLLWEELLAPTFKDGHLLATGNLPTVARILREAPLDDDEGDSGSKSSGVWKPQLHYAWSTILKTYFSPDDSELTGRASFQDFFRVAVDESLFSATASAERKSWGFSVIEQALGDLPPNEIPLLFTKNFMRTWINHLSNQDRFLHKAARRLAGAVQAVVDKHPAIGFTLVLQLLGGHGNRQFDKITKTKTVESIIAATNVEGVEKFIEYVKTQVYHDAGDGSDSKSTDAKRLWAVDQLTSLVRNGAIPREDKWVLSVLEFFVVHGFFTVVKKNTKTSLQAIHAVPNPGFSDAMKETCRSRLFTCLAELTSQSSVVKSSDGKISKAAASASDGELWLVKVLGMLSIAEADVKHVKPLVRPSSELRELRAKVLEHRKTFASLPASRQDAATGASILLISLLIQTYDPAANVEQALEDSVASVERLFAPPPDSKEKKKKKKRSSLPSAEAEREETLPIDEIIDVQIGFLEASSAYSRAIATASFSFLTGEVRRSTIHHILTQLEPRDVRDDPSDEEEEDDVADIDWGSDTHSDAGSPAQSSSGDSDTDNASGEDSSEHKGDGEIDLELRKKIAEALQVSGNGNDEDDEDEVVMDDDQMLKMDEQLAAIFRMQRGPNADKKRVLGLQRAATHFKIRVLDLIELYVRKQPGSPNIVAIVMPIIEAVRGARADEEQFASKATTLLENRIVKLKELPETGVDVSSTLKNLEDMHQLARNSPTPGFLSLLAQSSIYISRVLSHAGQDITIAELYQKSLLDFMTRKGSRLSSAFFQTWIKRHISIAWNIRATILDLCKAGNAVNIYRQMQAFQLLHDLLSQAHLLNDASQKVEVLDFLPLCRQMIYSTLVKTSGPVSDEEGLNANQLKQILKCALLGVRLTKRVMSSREEIVAIWDRDTLTTIAEQLQASERTKNWPGVLSLAKQLLGIVSPPKPKQKGPEAISGAGSKRKAEERVREDGNRAESVPKRQRTKVAEVHKRKLVVDSD